jgi:serine O-acetyltransferase
VSLVFDNLAHDLGRSGRTTRERVGEILSNPGMWAVLGYRFCHWVYRLEAPWLFRKPLSLFASLVSLFVQVTTNITLPSRARIGPGLYIAHTGYIVVNSRTVLGANCTLTQGVTIGHRGGGREQMLGSPVIGDRVYVGPGAAIIGPIPIGDDALIGVGAVVTKSVPERGVVAGNPARLLSRRGSFDLIDYPGMHIDPARLAALARRDEPEAGDRRSQGNGVRAGLLIDLGHDIE